MWGTASCARLLAEYASQLRCDSSGPPLQKQASCSLRPPAPLGSAPRRAMFVRVCKKSLPGFEKQGPTEKMLVAGVPASAIVRMCPCSGSTLKNFVEDLG